MRSTGIGCPGQFNESPGSQESHQIGLYVTLIVLVASFGTVNP
jgi:hypothetical protein